jgi:hypothetical protein
MFISTYKKIALLLSKEEKNLFFRLAILIIFISIIDTLSVATLYPFISIISNFEYPNNKIINQIINFLEIKEKSEIILLFGLIALLTITLSWTIILEGVRIPRMIRKILRRLLPPPPPLASKSGWELSAAWRATDAWAASSEGMGRLAIKNKPKPPAAAILMASPLGSRCQSS